MRWVDDRWTAEGEAALVVAGELAGRLEESDRLVGPPLSGKSVAKRLQEAATHPSFWQPTARRVALAAWRACQAGRLDDPLRLAPWYSRPSAAEEKRLAD